MSEQDLRVEIAVTLFPQDRLTLGQASAFAGLGRLDMQRTLGARRIPLHYGAEDLEHDLVMVEKRVRGGFAGSPGGVT